MIIFSLKKSKKTLPAVLFFLSFTSIAQQTQKFEYGIYADFGVCYPQASHDGRSDFGGSEINFSYRLGGIVNHNTLSWLGFRSGLLIDQRNYNASGVKLRRLYALNIPLQFRLTPGNVFSFNSGLHVNILLGRTPEENWATLVDANYNVADVTLNMSFEFRLFRGFHLGFGANWGITPWGESMFEGYSSTNLINYTHRGFFINAIYIFN